MAEFGNDWRAYLLTLEDEAFFDLMRNYFGNLQTPFNKHDLIVRLEAFLKREETIDRIVSLLDEMDKKLISAVSLLREPEPVTLFDCLEGEYSYLELHHRISNLEDRLILFTHRDNDVPRIRICPFLKNTLHELVISSDTLFPSSGELTGRHSMPLLTDPFMLALLSYISKQPGLTKADGGLKKKVETELTELFPEVFVTERMNFLLTILRQSPLFMVSDNTFEADKVAWEKIADMESLTRMLLLTCYNITGNNERAWTLAGISAGIVTALEKNKSFTRETLLRYLKTVIVLESLSSWYQEKTELLLESLCASGVFIQSDGLLAVNQHLPAYTTQNNHPRSVIVEANFDVTVKPDITLKEGLPLAFCCKIQRYDTMAHYLLDKETYARGIEFGIEPEEFFLQLSVLNEKPLPQNIAFSLEDWEKDISSLRILDGMVITVDESKQHFLDHNEEIEPFIRETLAPGVYLFGRKNMREWTAILRKIGFDFIPSLEREDIADTGRRDLNVLSSLFIPPNFPSIGSTSTVYTQKSVMEKDNAEAILQKFTEKITSLNLSPDQHKEAQMRVQRKLILYPEQLETPISKREKLEARGLDYIGKVRLIEQTLQSSNSILEVIERTADGTPRKNLLNPLELKKGTSNLYLIAETIPEHKRVRINVGKIGVVRKIRSSILKR